MDIFEIISILNLLLIVILVFFLYKIVFILSEINKESNHLRTLQFIHNELKDMNLLLRNRLLSSENKPTGRTWRG